MQIKDARITTLGESGRFVLYYRFGRKTFKQEKKSKKLCADIISLRGKDVENKEHMINVWDTKLQIKIKKLKSGLKNTTLNINFIIIKLRVVMNIWLINC